METHEVLDAAMRGKIEAIAYALRERGKRIGTRTLSKYMTPERDVKRLDPLAQFLRLWDAILDVDVERGEFVFEFLRNHLIKRRDDSVLDAEVLTDVLVLRDREHSETFAAIMQSSDASEIRRELVEDIQVARKLIALIDRREQTVAKLENQEWPQAA